jgi:hypothetical protein
MPGGDKTGPLGLGPMSGRAAGYCAGYEVPGFANPVLGRGFGGRQRCGRGGHGRRNRFYAGGMTGWQRSALGQPSFIPNAAAQSAPFTPASTQGQQIKALKNQAAYFEDALAGIRKHIEELEIKDKGK